MKGQLFMRKISVLLLICILFLNIGSVTIWAEDLEDYSNDIEIMNILGIMTGDENGDFNPKDCLTRAEFAKIVCVLDGFDVNTLYTENLNYKDLFANHWAYNYICYVTEKGYMTGDDNHRFRPDDCITGNEATKVLMHILGYDYRAAQNGGYPTGYITTADLIGMYKDFKGNTFDYILREEVAKLINNSLDIPLMELVSVGAEKEYSNSSGRTLLSQNFNMKRGKGLVLATDSAAILSNDKAFDNRVIIDGISMKTNEDLSHLLGSKVTYMYTFSKDDDSFNKLFYYNVLESGKVTILKEDFIDFINNTLIYETEDGELERLNISQTASYILNGSNKIYDSSIFNFNLGDITVVSTNNSKTYDVVIISKAEIITAGTIDARNEKIYDKYNLALFIDFSNSDLKYDIKNKSGELIGFNDIKENDILTIYKGEDKVKVVVNNDFVSGRVDSVSSDGFIINGKEYKLNYYGLLRKSAIAPGNNVTIYFDSYGYVANITMMLADENPLAYLVKLVPVTLDNEEEIIAKLFTKEGNFVEYMLADNVIVNDVNCKTRTYQEILNLILVDNSYNGVVNYKVVDGKIKILTTGKLYSEFSDSEDGICLRYENREREYFKGSLSFEYEVYYNNDTVFFKVPSDPLTAGEDEFEIVASNYFYDGGRYTLCGYIDNKDDIESSAVVVTAKVYPDKFEGHDVLCAVSKITDSVDANGEPVKKISVLKGKYGDSLTKKELYINTYENLKDEDNNYTFNDISEGDIVKFMYDKDGRIRKFKLFYKYSNGTLIDKTIDSDTNANDKKNINRVVKSTIDSVKQGYIELGNNELYKISDMQIIVLETNGTRTKAVEGELSDLVLNDQCIVQMISKKPYTIFVFK